MNLNEEVDDSEDMDDPLPVSLDSFIKKDLPTFPIPVRMRKSLAKALRATEILIVAEATSHVRGTDLMDCVPDDYDPDQDGTIFCVFSPSHPDVLLCAGDDSEYQLDFIKALGKQPQFHVYIGNSSTH